MAIPAATIAVLVQAQGIAKTNRDLGGLNKSLDDSGKKGGKALGGLKTAASALGGVAIGAGLVTGLKSAVGAFEESRKVGRQTAQVIKSTGGAANVTAKQVGDLAGSISKKTGIDDEAIQSGSNLLLTFKNIRNESGKGRDIFNQTTKAAVDLSAAGFGSIESTSKQLGKALNDPVKGLTALGRSGVTFSEDQKKAITALMETGKAADRVKAQQIILKEVNSQVGGSAAAQATDMDHLKVTLGNLQELIGGTVIKVVDGMAAALVGVIGVVSRVIGFFKQHETITIALASAIGVVLTAFLGFKALAAVQGAILAVRGAMVALNTAFLTNPIVLVVAAIAALVAAFVVAYRESETFRNIVNGAWNAIKDAAVAVWGFLKDFFSGWWGAIVTVVTTYIDTWKGVMSGAWNAIKTVAKAGWDAIKAVIVNPVKAAWEWMRGAVGDIGGFLRERWENIKNNAKAAWGLFKDYVVNPVRDAFAFIKENIIGPVVGFLRERWENIKNNARTAWNLFHDYVIDPVRSAFSKVREALRDVISWLGERVDDVKKIADRVARPFVGAFNGIKDAVKGVVEWLGKALGKVEDLIGWIGKIKIPKINIPGIGGGSVGPNIGPGAGDPGGFSAITNAASRFGNVVTSGYRPGDPGYHGMNRARDYAGGNMMGFARYMMSMYGSRLKELIYTPMGTGIKNGAPVDIGSFYGPAVAADHYDHVHVAMQNGGHVKRGGWALVGEQGPELARLPGGTTVYPNGMGPAGDSASLDRLSTAIERLLESGHAGAIDALSEVVSHRQGARLGLRRQTAGDGRPALL